MKVPIKLVPQGIIPRDPNLTFRVQRKAQAVPAVECPPPITLPAGADMFAGATKIPLAEYDNVSCEYTYNKLFSAETDEPQPVTGTPPQKTAWWKIDVPKGEKAWINLDLQRSFGNDKRPDTQLAMYAGTELSTFADLFRIGSSEDINTDFYFSRLGPIVIDGNRSGEDAGTTFFVQVGDYNDGVPGIAYGLRVSITFIEPGTIPDDGHDPDV